MKGVARKHNLYEQTQFQTEVVRASWIEDTKKWEIELKSEGKEETEIRFYDIMYVYFCLLKTTNFLLNNSSII